MPTQIRRIDVPTQPQVAPCPGEITQPGVESGNVNCDAHDPKKSGSTKEAAASKSAEHQFAGCAQEARLRDFQNPTVRVNGRGAAEPALVNDNHDPSKIESTQSPTVMINSKSAARKDDTHCDSSKEPIK